MVFGVVEPQGCIRFATARVPIDLVGCVKLIHNWRVVDGYVYCRRRIDKHFGRNHPTTRAIRRDSVFVSTLC
jgi:hypothetical protein